MGYYCFVCKETISKTDYEYSILKVNAGLCQKHQKTVTRQAIRLSRALKKMSVDNILEYFDGHKTVDMAILNAKLIIEIDGSQHTLDPQQVCADYDREKYSLKDGFFTWRISNRYIDSNLYQTALSVGQLANKRISELLETKLHEPASERNNEKGFWKTITNKAYEISEKLENFE
jgi:very-short-patch-repair endonuclease